MGNKLDGFKCDHLISDCCNAPIRFLTTADGYSINSWCEKCGNYVFNGRTEGLIGLWMGDLEAVIKNKGYVPEWAKDLVIKKIDE